MIIGHISIAYIGAYHLTGSVEIAVIAGLTTNIPDYFYYFQKDYNKTYNTLHHPHTKYKGVKLWLIYLLWLAYPPIGLHCLADIPCHNKSDGQWNKLAYIGEVILTITLIYFLIGGNSWKIG